MKLLVIEDNEDIREILIDELQPICNDILACESVEDFHKQQGINNLKKFDAAIIDINLPGINGLEFLKRFKSENELPTLFVITGDPFIEANFDELPEIYIFKKPVNMEMLISSIVASRSS